MTKADVMEHWDEIATNRRLTLERAEAHLERVESGQAYLLGDYQVVTSGGTSGRRGVFVWDFEGWLGFGLTRERASFWLRQNTGGGGDVRRAFVAAAHATHPTAILPRTFAGSPQLGTGRSFPVTLPLAEIVEGLNRSLVCELEERRTGGNFARRSNVSVSDRAEQIRKEGRPVRSRPRRQGDASTPDQNSREFSNGSLRLADVLDDNVPDRGVERLVRERKFRDGRLNERRGWVAPGCDLNHGSRDVDSGCLRASLGRSRSGIARSRFQRPRCASPPSRRLHRAEDRRPDRLSGSRSARRWRPRPPNRPPRTGRTRERRFRA